MHQEFTKKLYTLSCNISYGQISNLCIYSLLRADVDQSSELVFLINILLCLRSIISVASFSHFRFVKAVYPRGSFFPHFLSSKKLLLYFEIFLTHQEFTKNYSLYHVVIFMNRFLTCAFSLHYGLMSIDHVNLSS